MTVKKMSEISLQDLPPMRMACYQVVSQEPENEGSQFMEAWAAALGLRGMRRFGFDSPVSEEQAKAGLRGYEQWFEVPGEVKGADGVMIRQFPGGRYAVLRLFNPFEAPFETIPAGWQYLHEWVQSQVDVKDGCHQCLEELVPGQGNWLDLVLYYPIE